MTERTGVHSPAVAKRLRQSEQTLHWVHAKADGMTVPALPHDKRTQLALACWHVAHEHSMSIVLLVEQGMYGSALTLIRPCFEAYIRGMWLMHAATGEDLDRAGRDKFPNDINRIVADLERAGYDPGGLARLKAHWWTRLCSFNHTGYQQIGARLTADGLGYGYEDSEIEQALQWADGIALMSLAALADITKDAALGAEVLDYFRTAFRTTGQINEEPATT